MVRESREVWTKRVERLRESELNDVEFAAEIGVNVHTLRSWKWKLGHTTKRGRPPRSTARGSKPTFVEVMTPAGPADIELVVDERVRVRIPAGFDDETLQRVLAVLRRAP